MVNVAIRKLGDSAFRRAFVQALLSSFDSRWSLRMRMLDASAFAIRTAEMRLAAKAGTEPSCLIRTTYVTLLVTICQDRIELAPSGQRNPTIGHSSDRGVCRECLKSLCFGDLSLFHAWRLTCRPLYR